MAIGKRFIVTGGAGFIGRNLVEELNRRGENDILIVDRLGTSGKWKNLLGLHYTDLVDIEVFHHLMINNRLCDTTTMFHLGACSDTTETDADFLADINYRYTRDACMWCLKNGIRFIYASSAATYGDGSRGYSDDDLTTPLLAPLNAYAYSKHMFDMWALQNGLFDHIAGLKYFNVYGPYEDHKGEMRSVVLKAFEQIGKDGEVKLFKSYHPDYADGEQLRDFVYCSDAVAQTLFFDDNPEVCGLFNCGTGLARSWNDLAKAVFSAMKLEPQIRYIEMPPALRNRYQYHTAADMTKTRAAGYTAAFTTLEDGVKDYVGNYLLKNSSSSMSDRV